MKLFVGVTNNEWFQFLAERQPDKVNFWRPSTAGAARRHVVPQATPPAGKPYPPCGGATLR